MYEWQPKVKDVNERDLVLENNYGISSLSPIVTKTHLSEGDTLFISQNNNWKEGIQHVALGRHELYDIIFNFMSYEELAMITGEKFKEYKEKTLAKLNEL
jgi:hypothetical protein